VEHKRCSIQPFKFPELDISLCPEVDGHSCGVFATTSNRTSCASLNASSFPEKHIRNDVQTHAQVGPIMDPGVGHFEVSKSRGERDSFAQNK